MKNEGRGVLYVRRQQFCGWAEKRVGNKLLKFSKKPSKGEENWKVSGCTEEIVVKEIEKVKG